jgi:GH15 family glucan-1,4-alpha-glucosidase
MVDIEAYPPIAEHGLIGDQQTCALVSTDGTINWFCCPRFDSPSIFASLLDAEKGGQFRVCPQTDKYVSRQLYFPDTGVLITRFLLEEGVLELYDFMPMDQPWIPTDRHRIVRMMRVPRGRVTLRFEIAPRFDYGRAPHKLDITEHGAVFTSNGQTLSVHSSVPCEARGDDVVGTMTLQSGDVGGIGGLVLESAADGPPRQVRYEELDELFDTTVAAWRGWLARGTYRGRWRDMVDRSAITLKLLTYAPTGAPVAAATAGLPEQVGGERNWDYRYTWLRDASFTVQALDRLGFKDDAFMFMAWCRDRIEDARSSGPGPLQIMYRVDGTSDLEEFNLDHFEGYRGSSPVRIGNAAAEQLQLDTYGEMMDAIWHAERDQPVIGMRGWNDIKKIVDWVCDNWDQPEEGIWETRGGRQPFVYGRMMCWAAVDRGIRMALAMGSRPAPLDRWTKTRDAINEQILAKGWDAKQRALVQHYDSDTLDSSVLAALRLHYLVPLDEYWLGTLDAIERKLVSDSLVYRYDPAASPDGLQGSEGTFSMCTFWYVDALTRTGRLDDARLVFEKMLTYDNHLGLFGEELGETGEQLGNFPQAFTHLSLINAAVGLDRELDSRATRQARGSVGI